MKLSRTAFTLAIAMSDKVIVPRATLPMLECVRLTPLESGLLLQITATDLETSVLLELPYTGEPIKAPVTVKARALLRLLKTLDTPTIDLTSNATTVDAIGDGPASKTVTTAVKIDGINIPAEGLAEDYPTIAKPDLSAAVALHGLYGAMEFCLPGVSHDETRQAINAIAIEVSKKDAWVASTDGHRLYRAWIPTGKSLKLCVPRALLDVLFSTPGKKLMRRDEILSQEKSIAVPLENVSERMTGALMTRAFDPALTFPNVQAVTPNDATATTTIELPREGTIKLLTRAIAIASQERQAPIDLVVKGRPGAVLPELKIHVRNDDGSPTLLDAPAVVAGNDVILGINGHYLKKALEVMTSEKVLLHISAPANPVWLSEGARSKKALPASWQGTLKRSIVIMPMRTSYTGEVVDGIEVESLPAPAPATA